MTEAVVPEMLSPDAAVPEMLSPDATVPPAGTEAARAADAELNQLLTRFMDCASLVAKAIHRIRSQELFRALGYETFEAYIKKKELRFSRSFVYQLAKVGEVLENTGVDPEQGGAVQELQISKLAQIARLPSPDEQRQVLTTGQFEVKRPDGTRESRHLNDIPLRELSAELDDRLGIERQPRRGRGQDDGGGAGPAYGGAAAEAAYGGAVAVEASAAREALFGTARPADAAPGGGHGDLGGWSDFGGGDLPTGWRAALEQLVFQLQALDAAERGGAIAEVNAALAGLNPEIPF